MKTEARKLKAGFVITRSRTFTADDVIAFGRVSGDKGLHHLALDARGRLRVHGLHAATLATETTGHLDLLASELVFHFQRPVFAGDTLTCTCTVTRFDERQDRRALEAALVCRNQQGEEVLLGSTKGVVLEEA